MNYTYFLDFLKNSIKIVNFVKPRLWNSRPFQEMCSSCVVVHQELLAHLQSMWLPRWKVIFRVIELKRGSWHFGMGKTFCARWKILGYEIDFTLLLRDWHDDRPLITLARAEGGPNDVACFGHSNIRWLKLYLNKTVGLRMRSVTWNWFPIFKICWWIQALHLPGD